MRSLPALAAAAAALLAVAPGGAAAHGTTLVELVPSARCTQAAFVRAAGGRVVAPELGLYSLPAATAHRVVPALRERGALRLSTPNRLEGSLTADDFGDPLVPTEWWRAAIGVDTLTPPPAGKPVTIVDSGIDVTHPEFLDRQNTETLNPQEPAGVGGEHGTAVGSLVGAPANGVGVVGIYPEAILRSWDAARGSGTQLDTGEIVQGILTAANAGPGVVNLSLGSDEKELVIEQAIYEAVKKGTLVVAASGNGGDAGNPLGYPASIPHVLTVAASDRLSRVAGFSSRSRFVDLAAPGVGIPIATAIGKGWRDGDGTSYAAPLVSGASAWVWTVRPELDATQLFEVMRRSAVDIGFPGRDDAAGFGLLNVPAALAYPAPIPDPFEPNDDIEFVRPGGLYDNSVPPLTTPSQRVANVQARADRAEDPRDVYRIWLPRNGTVTAALTADTNLDLGLWKAGTVSVIERIVGNDRLAKATTTGWSEKLLFANKGAGRYAYLAVAFGKGAPSATYSLRVS
jgi:Subtilase family